MKCHGTLQLFGTVSHSGLSAVDEGHCIVVSLLIGSRSPPQRVVKNAPRHQGTQLGTKNLPTRGVYLQKIFVPGSDSRKNEIRPPCR